MGPKRRTRSSLKKEEISEDDSEVAKKERNLTGKDV